VEYIDSFNEAERKFADGMRKWMSEEITLSIKMLFMEKGFMCMDPNQMAE
jgi:hypothetical protein